jgi:hypothetical protein
MSKLTIKTLFVASCAWIFHTTWCAASSIEDIPIPPDARDVHRQSAEGSMSREMFYRIDRAYGPDSALTDQLNVLRTQGWTKCSGYIIGWNRYVDASHGPGQERTVFQNVTYWSKGKSLIMIASFYYGGVTLEGRPVLQPENSNEFVAITEDQDPAVKRALKLRCAN